MDKPRDIDINGIPDGVEPQTVGVLTSRLYNAINNFLNKTGIEQIELQISTPSQPSLKMQEDAKDNNRRERIKDDELTIEERALRYKAKPPIHHFEKLFFPKDIQDEIDFAVQSISALAIVHEDLNYKLIKPVRRRGFVLDGKPGTGKTALAHAITKKLGLSILSVTSADIDSKFHAVGTQNLQAAFYAAQRDKAVLHIEEADSICSQRIAETTSGSEQAINSLRNQLFSCLDYYPVITICTTNFSESFDKALETRLRRLNIPMPDESSRREIWRKCLFLPETLLLADDVSVDELAKVDDVCGREIADAVEDAILKAVLKARSLGQVSLMEFMDQNSLLLAIESAKARRIKKF